jgi:RNAse (barnase) inhibitor barstar
LGTWELLKPGHGVGYSSDGINNKLSDRFGNELSFAKKLKELYPNEKIALIKYSNGGTSIDSLAVGYFGSWEMDYIGKNGINQFDNFLTTIKESLKVKDIYGNGKEDLMIPSGIIWMHGEREASYTEEIANRYYSNLKGLMDLIRTSLLTDDLPVVLGKISDSEKNNDGKVWKYCELVQNAQEKYARTDKNNAIVWDTRYYKYTDQWYYDSEGYIDLGVKFAEVIYRLNKK